MPDELRQNCIWRHIRGATKLKENLRFLEESPERPALADHFLIEREFTARQ
jgi:hypothetical protein